MDGEAGVYNETIERLRPLVLELCREADPAAEVLLTPYRWPDGDVLDIALRLGGHVRHLDVPARRLAEVEHNPQLLRNDLEAMTADLRRAARPERVHHDLGAVDDAGFTGRRAAAESGIPSPTDPLRSPAAEGVNLPHDESGFHRLENSPAWVLGEPIAPTLTRDTPDTGEIPRTGIAPAMIHPQDRGAVEHTKQLARHMVEELDPRVTVSFEEYLWHGDLTLDITIALHGHEHHYEITADRCRLMVLDHHMLEHDLEGIVLDLQREAAHAHP